MYPSVQDYALLLPWILGAVASGTTFALAETLSDRYVCVDKGAKVFTYAGCVVNKAVFSGSDGAPVKLTLDIVGKTQTVSNSGTFPSVSYNTAGPFMFSEAALTLLGTSGRLVKSWSITIDNQLEVNFYNSRTASRIVPKDRSVTFSCANPFTADETDLFDQALAGSAATLTLTYGAMSMEFAFATLQFPHADPQVSGRSEIGLALDGTARKAGSTSELIVTLDSTP